VGVVVPYLLSHRTRLLASLEEAAAAAAAAAAAGRSKESQQQAALTNGAEAAANSSSSKSRSKPELELVAAVIDTAILRAMLLQPDSGALLRLLQQTNFVDVEDGEAVLTAAGRYAELAALYQYNRWGD
jgi:septal ring factor EnvC (AmiA/AmiB activator)